jgi:hypothetical protein
MSIQITDNHHVALYDSVTGLPIQGLPVFEGWDQADDFARWFTENWNCYEEGLAEQDSDIRCWRPVNLKRMYRRWWDERVDGETGEIKPELYAQAST